MIISSTRFIDGPRVKRELYSSNRIKYVGVNMNPSALTTGASWKITKYSDDDIVTDQQTLENVSWDNRGSLSWGF